MELAESQRALSDLQVSDRRPALEAPVPLAEPTSFHALLTPQLPKRVLIGVPACVVNSVSTE